jgi:hypothetical protein
VSRLQKVTWTQTCETAVLVISLTGKTPVIGKSPMEMWKGHVLKNLTHLRVFGTECYVYIPQQFQKKFDNKSLFGRMIGYLNYKDGYQVYVQFPSKTVHSHVYLQPERVCTSSVVETGLNNAAVEDVGEQKRQENDTLSETSQSEKILEEKLEEEFSRNRGRPISTVKWPLWIASGDYILLLVRTAVVGGGDPSSYRETMHSAQKEE